MIPSKIGESEIMEAGLVWGGGASLYDGRLASLSGSGISIWEIRQANLSARAWLQHIFDTPHPLIPLPQKETEVKHFCCLEYKLGHHLSLKVI